LLPLTAVLIKNKAHHYNLSILIKK